MSSHFPEELVKKSRCADDFAPKGLFGYLLLLYCPVGVFGSGTEDRILAAAITSFNQGRAELHDAAAARVHFARAEEMFQQLTDSGVYNATHSLNQGNAALLAGSPGKAIFSYRRGLLLAPNNPLLCENLQYARKLVRQARAANLTRPPAEPGWPRLDSAATFLATFVFWSLACFCVALWLIRAQFVWLAAGLLSMTLVGLGVVYLGWQTWQLHVEAATPLVVIVRDKTPLHQGNGASYPLHPDVPELSEGVEARRLHARGDWLQIQFASSVTGWIRREAALVNEPLDQKGAD